MHKRRHFDTVVIIWCNSNTFCPMTSAQVFFTTEMLVITKSDMLSAYSYFCRNKNNSTLSRGL